MRAEGRGVHLAVGQSPRWGPARLISLIAIALVLLGGASGCGLVARAQAGVPRDDSAASQAFISWALAEVSRQSASSGVTSLQLSNDELDLTMRHGDVDQHWQAFPQDLPRMVDTQPLDIAKGTVETSKILGDHLELDWKEFTSEISSCAQSDIRLAGNATWGGVMHYTASCAHGTVTTEEWIGSWPVELQDGLSTQYSLSTMMSDLTRLSPKRIASVEFVAPDTDEQGCRAATTWRQQAAGQTGWITQTRFCYAQGSKGFLPISTGSAPPDADTLLEHPLDLTTVDPDVLAGLTAPSGLPSDQSGINRLRIAWSDRFGQQVIEASSGDDDSPQTGWYSLSGTLLALDRA